MNIPAILADLAADRPISPVTVKLAHSKAEYGTGGALDFVAVKSYFENGGIGGRPLPIADKILFQCTDGVIEMPGVYVALDVGDGLELWFIHAAPFIESLKVWAAREASTYAEVSEERMLTPEIVAALTARNERLGISLTARESDGSSAADHPPNRARKPRASKAESSPRSVSFSASPELHLIDTMALRQGEIEKDYQAGIVIVHPLGRHQIKPGHYKPRIPELSVWDTEGEAAQKALVDRLWSLKGSKLEILMGRYCFGRLVDAPPEGVAISVSELTGLMPYGRKLTSAQRAEAVEQLARMFRDMACFFIPIPDGADEVTRSPVWFIETRYSRDARLPGFNEADDFHLVSGFTFKHSSLSQWCQRHPRALFTLGSLNDLAAIPAGQPGGDWAQSIGMMASKQGRRGASESGAAVKLTIAKALEMVERGGPAPADVTGYARVVAWLATEPRRVIKTLQDAAEILRERQIMEVRLPSIERRPGFTERLGELMLEITLLGDRACRADGIQQRRIGHALERSTTARKPGRPRTKARKDNPKTAT